MERILKICDEKLTQEENTQLDIYIHYIIEKERQEAKKELLKELKEE